MFVPVWFQLVLVFTGVYCLSFTGTSKHRACEQEKYSFKVSENRSSFHPHVVQILTEFTECWRKKIWINGRLLLIDLLIISWKFLHWCFKKKLLNLKEQIKWFELRIFFSNIFPWRPLSAISPSAFVVKRWCFYWSHMVSFFLFSQHIETWTVMLSSLLLKFSARWTCLFTVGTDLKLAGHQMISNFASL